MKWSFFGKKRIEFCSGKSTISSPNTPSSSAAPSPRRSFAGCTAIPPSPSLPDYVGTKLSQVAQSTELIESCSAEFLTDHDTARPARLSPLVKRDVRAEDEALTATAEEDESPLTPCSVRSCPEPEQVLGFCPNCHSVVLPLTKKRSRIRTNPWLLSKRPRVGGEPPATSVTDSGIFEVSPATSAQESAQTPGSDTPRPRKPCADSTSSSDDETLLERRRNARKRRKKKQKLRKPLPVNENVETDDTLALANQKAVLSPANEIAEIEDVSRETNQKPLLLFPRGRSRREKSHESRSAAFRPILAPSPVFQLPQSDNSELWEIPGELPSAPVPQRPSPLRPTRVEDEDAMADAEVCEYSRRQVCRVRSSLRERIDQLKKDRILLEERLQVTRGALTLNTQQDECWTREIQDYRKQLLLRILASAKGQANRHLDRLQDSYNALLLEKLNSALETVESRHEAGYEGKHV